MTALRRRFLLDMAWPVSSDLLCHMFGLIDASPEVRTAEKLDSEARMERLASDEALLTLLTSAAEDAAQVLALVDGHDERTAWLTTYAMAVITMLEGWMRYE
jgi:hypothetical protein